MVWVIATLLLAPLILSQMSLRFGGQPQFSGVSQFPNSFTTPLGTNQQDLAPYNQTMIGPRGRDASDSQGCIPGREVLTTPGDLTTCGADGGYWFLDSSGTRLVEFTPDGTIRYVAVPAGPNMMTTVTAGPGGSSAADALWLTGPTDAAVYVPMTGRTAIYKTPGAQPISPIAVGKDGSLKFRMPSNGSIAYVTPQGRIVSR
jgi:hypothetical protein